VVSEKHLLGCISGQLNCLHLLCRINIMNSR